MKYLTIVFDNIGGTLLLMVRSLKAHPVAAGPVPALHRALLPDRLHDAPHRHHPELLHRQRARAAERVQAWRISAPSSSSARSSASPWPASSGR